MKTIAIIIIIAILPLIIEILISVKKLRINKRKATSDRPLTEEEKTELMDIISKRYNNYNGRFYSHLKQVHSDILKLSGGYGLLCFLRNCEITNPKPVYKNPYISNK